MFSGTNCPKKPEAVRPRIENRAGRPVFHSRPALIHTRSVCTNLPFLPSRQTACLRHVVYTIVRSTRPPGRMCHLCMSFPKADNDTLRYSGTGLSHCLRRSWEQVQCTKYRARRCRRIFQTDVAPRQPVSPFVVALPVPAHLPSVQFGRKRDSCIGRTGPCPAPPGTRKRDDHCLAVPSPTRSPGRSYSGHTPPLRRFTHDALRPRYFHPADHAGHRSPHRRPQWFPC